MKKKLFVMTSFGPVPFEAVKEHLPEDVVNAAEFAANQAFTVMNPDNVEFYIHNLAEKKGWEYKKMVSYLENLGNFSKVALLNVLLREIAIYLDERYEDSIDKAEEIFVISTLNGKVVKVENKSVIKNFRNFAAFRTEEDAKTAHRILSKLIRKIFRGCGE